MINDGCPILNDGQPSNFTSDDTHLRIAGHDALHSESHRLQTRATQHVDAVCRNILRDARAHRRLAGGVLTLAGGEHLAKDYFTHFLGGDTGALCGSCRVSVSGSKGKKARELAQMNWPLFCICFFAIRDIC